MFFKIELMPFRYITRALTKKFSEGMKVWLKHLYLV